MNAGALPAFAAALAFPGGGGAGLLRIAKYGRRGRNAAYLSYAVGRGRGRPARDGAADDDVELEVRVTARVSSA